MLMMIMIMIMIIYILKTAMEHHALSSLVYCNCALVGMLYSIKNKGQPIFCNFDSGGMRKNNREKPLF